MACTRWRRWRYDDRGRVITDGISRIAVVVIRIGDDERLVKPVMEGLMAKRVVCQAAVISEGHASGGRACCAEAQGNC